MNAKRPQQFGRNQPVANQTDADLLRVGGFGSFHVGGGHFAFGDGSVRFLTENIQSQTVTTHRQLEWTRFRDFGRSVW